MIKAWPSMKAMRVVMSQKASGPKVSVCICSYNHSRYLSATLDSVLSQSHAVHEVIIVDDGSADNSLDIARRYSSVNPVVKVYTHSDHANKGVSATANLAFRRATGDYICWLGSDDLWNEGKVERQVRVMERDSALGLIYSRAAIIDENSVEVGQVIGESIVPGVDQTAFLIGRNVIPALTVMFRRACFGGAGLLDEGVLYSDWELWVRISACWKVAFMEDVLAKYRIHGTNVSVGVGADVDLLRRLDTLHSLKRERADRSSMLLTSKYGSEIDQAIEATWEKIFAAYLDRYYLMCRRGSLFRALGYLFKAMKLRPMKLVRARRMASLLKYAVVGITKRQQAC